MPAARIVITDANILINLIHVGRLDLLGCVPPFKFLVVDEVRAEITDPDQIRALNDAFAQGSVEAHAIHDLQTLTLMAQLAQVMGRGEAASLAAAETNGWIVACDEKRVFLREAVARLGENKILTTPGILVLAIRASVITIAEADGMKAHLETRRFRMKFASFSDVV